MADQDQKPASADDQQNDFQPSPFALKEPPALKSMASTQSAPPPFSFRTPITPQVISGSPKPANSLPGYQQSSVPLQPLQPLQALQPTQALQPLQPLQPQSQQFGQMQPMQPSPAQQSMPFTPFQQVQQGFPLQSQAAGVGYFSQQPHQPQQPMFPQQTSQPQVQSHQSSDDQSQQILTKLQQFMNQMNSFMKSVDARLTTLEKMVQQVAVVQNQQLELAKASQLPISHPPSHSQPVAHPGVSAHPPPDFSRAVSDFPEPQHYPHSTPPPYLPDPYQPEYRAPTNYYGKSRQELDDEELARRLQQEFNFEAQKVDTKKMAAPTPNNSGGTDECPVCKLTLPLRELEVHVQTHFPEFYETFKRPVLTEKPQEEKSLWDRLFGSDDEKASPPPPQPTLYPSFYNSSPPAGYSYINPN